jgi:hypothetical protein
MGKSRSAGRTSIPAKLCFVVWLEYCLDGLLFGVTEEWKICLEGKTMFRPSFHQRTVSVGFSVRRFE